jgi:hypothetical protein
MLPIRLFAATCAVVARLESPNGTSVQTTIVLGGAHQSCDGTIVNGVTCIAVDPHDPQRIFARTFDRGIYRSLDGGEAWESVGSGVPGTAISN